MSERTVTDLNPINTATIIHSQVGISISRTTIFNGNKIELIIDII